MSLGRVRTLVFFDLLRNVSLRSTGVYCVSARFVANDPKGIIFSRIVSSSFIPTKSKDKAAIVKESNGLLPPYVASDRIFYSKTFKITQPYQLINLENFVEFELTTASLDIDVSATLVIGIHFIPDENYERLYKTARHELDTRSAFHQTDACEMSFPFMLLPGIGAISGPISAVEYAFFQIGFLSAFSEGTDVQSLSPHVRRKSSLTAHKRASDGSSSHAAPARRFSVSDSREAEHLKRRSLSKRASPPAVQAAILEEGAPPEIEVPELTARPYLRISAAMLFNLYRELQLIVRDKAAVPLFSPGKLNEETLHRLPELGIASERSSLRFINHYWASLLRLFRKRGSAVCSSLARARRISVKRLADSKVVDLSSRATSADGHLPPVEHLSELAQRRRRELEEERYDWVRTIVEGVRSWSLTASRISSTMVQTAGSPGKLPLPTFPKAGSTSEAPQLSAIDGFSRVNLDSLFPLLRALAEERQCWPVASIDGMPNRSDGSIFFIRTDQHAPAAALPTGNVLTVFVHGYGGSQFDMLPIKNTVALGPENTPRSGYLFFIAVSNEGHTDDRIEKQGARLAAELARVLEEISVAQVNFVGHSLGNVVIRAALQEPALRSILPKLGFFVSFCGPHLGMHSASQLVTGAMAAMRRFKKSGAISDLMLKARRGAKGGAPYLSLLAAAPSFAHFREVVLVTTLQDGYVAPFSAACAAADLGAPADDALYRELAQKVEQQLRAVPIVKRIVVDFSSVTLKHIRGAKKIDAKTGRAAHIHVLEDFDTIKHVLHACTFL